MRPGWFEFDIIRDAKGMMAIERYADFSERWHQPIPKFASQQVPLTLCSR
jgi:hypothetical protein